MRCARCGEPLDQAADGTLFVYGTGTSADGLSMCPPDPDHDEEETGVPIGSHEIGGEVSGDVL